jgi:hypothetical protein
MAGSPSNNIPNILDAVTPSFRILAGGPQKPLELMETAMMALSPRDNAPGAGGPLVSAVSLSVNGSLYYIPCVLPNFTILMPFIYR